LEVFAYSIVCLHHSCLQLDCLHVLLPIVLSLAIFYLSLNTILYFSLFLHETTLIPPSPLQRHNFHNCTIAHGFQLSTRSDSRLTSHLPSAKGRTTSIIVAFHNCSVTTCLVFESTIMDIHSYESCFHYCQYLPIQIVFLLNFNFIFVRKSAVGNNRAVGNNICRQSSCGQ